MERAKNGHVDNIEYVSIAQGEDGGPKEAKEEVITSQGAYSAFFDDSPPVLPDVDWEHEMVVAVALGERTSGGYSVQITSISLVTMGFLQGTVTIWYVETTPSGGSTDPFIYPYHAVKCQRVGYRYDFIKDGDD